MLQTFVSLNAGNGILFPSLNEVKIKNIPCYSDVIVNKFLRGV